MGMQCEKCGTECFCYACKVIELEKKVADLAKFKLWVHEYLDNVGVPHDPDPGATKQHGCRISGRMRWLLEHTNLGKSSG